MNTQNNRFKLRGTFRAGWPDKVVDGIAIEEKKWGDKMRPAQYDCHEWLYRATGKYPLIEATDAEGHTHMFKSYIEFDAWRHLKGYKGNHKRLNLNQLATLAKAGLIKPVA